MTEKRTETYWYDDKGTLIRKQVHTEKDITTEWYPGPQPVYTPPTLPWVSPLGTVSYVREPELVSYNKTDHTSHG